MSETTKQAKPFTVALREKLDARIESIAEVIPNGIDPARFISTAIAAIGRDEKLQRCTFASLASAIKDAASIGLEIGSDRGYCYLIAYGKDAKLMVGYKGFQHLAWKSGQIKSFISGVVRKGDTFDYQEGSDAFLTHRRNIENLDGKPLAFYAAVITKDDACIPEVLSLSEVEAIRQRSRSANSGPWVTDFEEMGRKTAVRRLAKSLQFAPALAKAASLDDADFERQSRRVTDNPYAIPATEGTPPEIRIESYDEDEGAPSIEELQKMEEVPF